MIGNGLTGSLWCRTKATAFVPTAVQCDGASSSGLQAPFYRVLDKSSRLELIIANTIIDDM